MRFDTDYTKSILIILKLFGQFFIRIENLKVVLQNETNVFRANKDLFTFGDLNNVKCVQ